MRREGRELVFVEREKQRRGKTLLEDEERNSEKSECKLEKDPVTKKTVKGRVKRAVVKM